MKYKIDHDLHIHSQISLCSKDPEQTNERILKYAEDNGFKKACLTNHFWDENVNVDYLVSFYKSQNYEHIAAALPLPKKGGIDFLFGCETDFDKNFTLGLSKDRFDSFSFVIIPTTHFHMKGFTVAEESTSPEALAKLWTVRLEKLLALDLPFEKIGIAHLACPLIYESSREEYLNTLKLIPDSEMFSVFSMAAKKGVGIELNRSDMSFENDEAETVLRMFKIAKKCGCKFYLGSDAHHPEELDSARTVFTRAVDLLGLSEEDKYHI